ncbi:MAG: TIGR00730 family Rossman fold protein [Acidobacteria bacterium]|nr:TIGR00730 family Rossman fold protein [Acidobacteriota bacterium]
MATRQLAHVLVSRDIGLVYGGANVGLMGVLATAVLEQGGEVIGVIPESLVDLEIAHRGLTQLHVTQSMHARKKLMADLSDGFLALPGGIGTLEEIFEMWTWSQLGLQQKACGLLNVANYFASLCAFLDQMVAEKFVKAAHRDFLVVERDPERLVTRLCHEVQPYTPKWIGPPSSGQA